MLIDYLPPALHEIKEFKVLMECGDTENTALKEKILKLEKDQYFLDATEKGIKRYEKMFGIIPKGTDTLEDRSFRVFARYNQQVPYTRTVLENKLITLCGKNGYKIQIDYENSVLILRISLTAKAMYEEVENYIENIIPLNMIIDMSLIFNQHSTLSKFTHAQLKIYTHKQIREEDL